MPWMLPVAGALGGALLNKKNPLKGALLGGALGATGGALAPAAAGAAGGIAGSGLTAGTGTLGTIAAGTGGTGISAAGSALGSGIGSSIGASSPGLLAQAGQYATPALQGLQAASMVQGMTQEPPMQAAPLQLRPGPDMSGLLAQGVDPQEEERRRLTQQQAVQGLLGGGYARIA